MTAQPSRWVRASETGLSRPLRIEGNDFLGTAHEFAQYLAWSFGGTAWIASPGKRGYPVSVQWRMQDCEAVFVPLYLTV